MSVSRPNRTLRSHGLDDHSNFFQKKKLSGSHSSSTGSQQIEFEGVRIRSFKVGSEVCLVLRDVCEALYLENTTAVAARLQEDNLKRTKVMDAMGRERPMLLVTKRGLNELLLTAQGGRGQPDHVRDSIRRFKNWVLDVIEQIETTGHYELPPTIQPQLAQHMDVHRQKRNSRVVGRRAFEMGGVPAVADYYTASMMAHTGLRPQQVIQQGKEAGLRSKDTSSARQVLRKMAPAHAASMSFTDELVSRKGGDPILALHGAVAVGLVEDAKHLFNSAYRFLGDGQ